MKIAVVKESAADERRVALVPDAVSRLVKQRMEVWVESGRAIEHMNVLLAEANMPYP
jgi:alanine dehydrogenase